MTETTVIETAIIALKTAILLLGGLITYFAFKAYRRTRHPSLRALAIGFGVVTLGALLAGLAHQLFGVGITTGVLINSLLTAVGFAVITYSLYAD
jgi:heme/copper-type cytochrome/quinol oxidase subunit 3